MYENFVVQSLISSKGREGLTGSYAALGLVLKFSELQMCLTAQGGTIIQVLLNTLTLFKLS